MSAAGDSQDDAIFYDGEGRMLRGPLAHVGTILVRGSSIRFEPSRLDWFAGARTWTIATEELTGLRRRESDGALELSTAEGTQLVSGDTVDAIEQAVRRALAARLKTGTEPPEFVENERIVFEVSARVQDPSMATRSGTLTLTNLRLHFAHTGDDRLEAGPVGLHALRETVRDVRTANGVVTVRTDEGNYYVTVADWRPLFAALCGIGERQGLGPKSCRAREVSQPTASDPILGVFASTQRFLRFAPEDRSASLELAWQDISRVRLAASGGERLMVWKDATLWEFDLPKARHEFKEITYLMTELRVPGEPGTDDAGCFEEAALADLLSQWQAELGRLTPGRVALAGPGAVVFPVEGVVRGAMLLTDQGLVFLPSEGPGRSEPHLAMPLDTVTVQHTSGTEGPCVVVKRPGGGLLRAIPRGGESFLRRFGGHLQRLTHVQIQGQFHQPNASRTKNRRNSYRSQAFGERNVQLAVSGSGTIPSNAPLFTARLVDLSTQGCSVALDDGLPAVTSFEIEFPGTEEPFRVRADLVHEHQPTAKSAIWRYGFRFVRTTPEQDRSVRELSMELQREELVRRRERE